MSSKKKSGFGGGGKKPLGGAMRGGFKSKPASGGAKRTNTTTAAPKKKSTTTTSSSKSGEAAPWKPTRRLTQDDEEILYLQKMLGIKKKRDVGSKSRLVEEFKGDGLDDFMDILFEMNEDLIEDDDTTDFDDNQQPFDMKKGGLLSAEEAAARRQQQQKQQQQQQQQQQQPQRDINLDESDGDDDDDDDDEEITFVGGDDLEVEELDPHAIMMMDEGFGFSDLEDDDNNNGGDDMTDESGSDSDAAPRDISAKQAVGLKNNEKYDKNKNKNNQDDDDDDDDDAFKNAISSRGNKDDDVDTSGVTTAPAPGKYIPPHLRKKLGISFDRNEMKQSFTQYLAQNESFVDTKNEANQNAYRYYGILTDPKQHTDVFVAIQSKLNKISHMNIAHIFEELVELLVERETPFATFNELFVIAVYEFCTTQRTILSSTIQAIGVLCSGFHKVFGVQYGSIMLETFLDVIQKQIVQNYTLHYKTHVETCKSQLNNGNKAQFEAIFLPQADLKPILNLCDIVGVMYLSKSVPTQFFFGFVQWLCNDLSAFVANAISGKAVEGEEQDLTLLFDGAAYTTAALASVANTPEGTEAIKAMETKLPPLLIWNIQCAVLSNLFMNFGLTMRRDDHNTLKNVFKALTDDSNVYDKQWTTQHLIAVLNAVRNGKQFYPSDEGGNANEKNTKAAVLEKKKNELVDFAVLHEQLYKTINFILSHYNEELLDKKSATGRRLNRKEQIKKQLQDLQTEKSNKQNVNIKYATQHILNITFNDLLRVRQTGRWWIVGAGFKQTKDLMNKNQALAAAAGVAPTDAMGDHTGGGGDEEDDDDDDDDVLSSINTAELHKKADELGFKSPLDRYIFATLISSLDYVTATRNIASKHSHHINSTSHSNNNNKTTSNIVILPSQYQQVVKIIITMALSEDTYNVYYSGVLMKLLSQFPDYRFPCITALWDIIKTMQMDYVGGMKQGKALKAKPNEKKMKALMKKMSTVKTTAMNLAKLIADLVVQPSTIDLYALKKMALNSLMLMVLEDINNTAEEGENEGGDDKDLFDNITTITAQDFGKMNDNTILFLATLTQRLADRILQTTAQAGGGGSKEEQETYITDTLKRLIVPLQAAKSTNYLRMEVDLVKLQFTTVSKYEKVRRVERGKHAVKSGNPAGARVLSCVKEAMQLFVLPSATQSKNAMLAHIAKEFIALADTDLVTHK